MTPPAHLLDIVSMDVVMQHAVFMQDDDPSWRMDETTWAEIVESYDYWEYAGRGEMTSEHCAELCGLDFFGDDYDLARQLAAAWFTYARELQ